jgi:hypothetical protein
MLHVIDEGVDETVVQSENGIDAWIAYPAHYCTHAARPDEMGFGL